jgi:hypothetical protein
MLGIRVAYSSNLAEVVAMISLLEEHDVHVYDIDMSSHLSLAGADLGWYVEVLREHEESARAIIKDSNYAKFICGN